MTGGPCPSRRCLGRPLPPNERPPRAVGRTGPRLFRCSAPAGAPIRQPRAHAVEGRRTRGFSCRGLCGPGHPSLTGATLVTATLTPQPKWTDDRARRIVLLPDRPVRPGDRDTVVGERLPVPAALLAEGVTKRFQVERKKPPVIAIAGVTMRLDRG